MAKGKLITTDERSGQWAAIELWIKNVDEIYCDFGKRIDPQSWKFLLKEEVCQNPDTGVRVRNALLDYMLDHFFIPQSVMLMLDKHFGFIENIDELLEIYEEDFLENVIKNGINMKEAPPYEFFDLTDPMLPFDEYLFLSEELHEALGVGSKKESREILTYMEATGVKTPYLYLEQAQVCCKEGNYLKALQCLQRIPAQYSDLEDVMLLQGSVFRESGNIHGAKGVYEKVLNKNPQSLRGRYGMAKCLMIEGDFVQAGEILEELMQENPYDSTVEDAFLECNRRQIKYLEDSLEGGESDQKQLVQLAWCYGQNEQYEQAISLLEEIQPEDSIKLSYYDTLSRCCIYGEQWEKGAESLRQWERLLREPEMTKSEGQCSMLAANLALQSLFFENQKEWDTAITKINEAIEMESKAERGEYFLQKGKLFFNIGGYEEAVECYTRVTALGQEFHTAYILRAEAYYEMSCYREACRDCERAIAMHPYELGAYICKIKALCEAEKFNAAEAVMEKLLEDKVKGSRLEFLQGYLQEYMGHDKKAEKIYKRILDHRPVEPEGENMFNVDNVAEVYYRLACIEYDEDADDLTPVIEIIDEGLSEDEEYVPLLELKADILHFCEMEEDELSLRKKIWQLQPYRQEICLDIEEVYWGLEQWDQALTWVQRQIDIKPSGNAYLRRGEVLTRLRRFEEAWSDLSYALAQQPDLFEVYAQMGKILDAREDAERAAAYYDKAILLGESTEWPCKAAYTHRANLYCREGKFQQSVELLDRAYEQIPDSVFLLQQIEVCRVGGMFDEARRILRKFTSLEHMSRFDFLYNWEMGHIERNQGLLDAAYDYYQPEGIAEPAARREAGKILYDRGKYRKALKFFCKAIDQLDQDHDYLEDPYERAYYYLWAAKACLKLGNSQKAVAFAKGGMGQIPEDFEEKLQYCLPEIYMLKGALHAVSGAHEEAEQCLKRALKERKCDLCNYSGCVEAIYELGYLCELTGNPQQALEYYTEGQRIAPYSSNFNRAVKNLID